VHDVVALDGLGLGLGTGDDGVSAGEEQDACRCPVHAAPGPWKDHGVVADLGVVVLGKFCDVDLVAEMGTEDDVLDPKRMAPGAPRAQQTGHETGKAVVGQDGLADALGARNDLVSAGKELCGGVRPRTWQRACTWHPPASSTAAV